MSLYGPYYVQGVVEVRRRVLDLLELESQLVVIYHVGDGKLDPGSST